MRSGKRRAMMSAAVNASPPVSALDRAVLRPVPSCGRDFDHAFSMGRRRASSASRAAPGKWENKVLIGRVPSRSTKTWPVNRSRKRYPSGQPDSGTAVSCQTSAPSGSH